MSNCEVVTFPNGILGQVWCLLASIPDLCPFSYFRGLNMADTCQNPPPPDSGETFFDISDITDQIDIGFEVDTP